MELIRKFWLPIAFMLSTIVLLLWYVVFNPSPPPELALNRETISETAELHALLAEEITELGVAEEISKNLPLERLKKFQAELAGILAHQATGRICEQYALVAASDGWFPCHNCGEEIRIFLKNGEVWKYGKTCMGQMGRYSGGLPHPNLRFRPEFKGTEIQCLVVEKIKIYNYLVHPENIARALANGTVPMLRPAGNLIDR